MTTQVKTNFNKNRPIATTSGGKVQGYRETTGLSDYFYAFKRIPYAEPPIGKLRFKSPVAHKGWLGIRDASKHGDQCPSHSWRNIFKGRSEDCLFLNVYTPNMSGNFAVMFWVHAGGFVGESGNSFVYGPDLLVRENVVVVTFNFRLAVLGFLSTGDKHAQGNYGLKDTVMALKWVKLNIADFGGDPNRVTVFGMSSGATTAHMLLMSEMSRDLLQQVILQSGNALVPSLFQANPKFQAEKLGAKLGLKFDSTESLVEQLRLVDHMEILAVQRSMFEMDNPWVLSG